jgi:hypothetical protein
MGPIVADEEAEVGETADGTNYLANEFKSFQ